MRVLVACEYSGTVRDAFIRAGHDAMSCDLLPTESPGPHYTGDVFDVLHQGWDLMIAHPPCTYLCNSGVRWLHTQEGRLEKMIAGARFFKELLNADIPRIAVENPIMHKYAAHIIERRQDQIVQPWQFGHEETKATGLWLVNLPPLEYTNVIGPPTGAQRKEWARVHNMGPSADRGKLRSLFFTGIADAMAQQWGALNDWQCDRCGRAYQNQDFCSSSDCPSNVIEGVENNVFSH